MQASGAVRSLVAARGGRVSTVVRAWGAQSGAGVHGREPHAGVRTRRVRGVVAHGSWAPGVDAARHGSSRCSVAPFSTKAGATGDADSFSTSSGAASGDGATGASQADAAQPSTNADGSAAAPAAASSGDAAAATAADQSVASTSGNQAADGKEGEGKQESSTPDDDDELPTSKWAVAAAVLALVGGAGYMLVDALKEDEDMRYTWTEEYPQVRVRLCVSVQLTPRVLLTWRACVVAGCSLWP